MDKNDKRPEWVPDNAGDAFSTHVAPGVEGGHDGLAASSRPSLLSFSKRRMKSAPEYVDGVLKRNRTILAQAITLAESNNPGHMQLAQEVLQGLLPYAGQSIRVGITGVPGAGKSSFIEALGTKLCDQGLRVAVLAIDPSSSLTKGSILGDKTRMENLSRHPNAFIRPSASGGTLGGVARKTRETMLICEAAGYDVILVETVGVGQSEVTVRSMVDFFLLLQITGAGDELQGMKKGIMELADAILIHKADGENRQRALAAKAEFNQILHYLKPATEGWATQAYMASSLTGEGLEDLWELIRRFEETTKQSGVFERRRQSQALEWMHSMIQDYLKSCFYSHPLVKENLPIMEQKIKADHMSPTKAVQDLIRFFENRN